MHSLEIHHSFSLFPYAVDFTILVVVLEPVEQQNQYLIKSFQIGELQLFQLMSMK